MKERPILFSAQMVKAILDGRKTQTRRVCKDQTKVIDKLPAKCPYGHPGDRLWVRETWAHVNATGSDAKPGDSPQITLYRATCTGAGLYKWRPSILMPRWASRITLEVVSVRVERLQEIRAQDTLAEGINIQGPYEVEIYNQFESHSVAQFAYLWDSIYGKKQPWASNPWVWRIEFRKIG